ncbi:hypothetical protein BE21_54260 [Sorangium cellulosum]|uniref:Uncharacterized protein n=1 Tax=Sorangium cellulosum TaxID=56 RepID=A0A150TDP3_SORCE|nr:hypothetical protein BE21_54260 [Sorangium cellulosum]
MSHDFKKHLTTEQIGQLEAFCTSGIAAEVNSDSSLDSWMANERWRYVWLQTVARAWSDSTFRDNLLKDAREAIRLTFGFNLPAYVDLKVMAPQPRLASEHETETIGWNQKGNSGGWRLPPMKVIMWLPPAPPGNDQAVALAEYAHSGRTYPFSTC